MRFRRPTWPALAAVVVGLLGAWIAILIGGRLEYRLGPVDVEYFARPGRPGTEIVLPPFGRIIADTHVSPLRVTASVESVDPIALQRAIRRLGVQPVVSALQTAAFAALRSYVPAVIALATIGAVGAGVLVFRDRIRRVLVSTLSGALVTTIVMGLSGLGFNAAAFNEPEYTGSLRLASRLIGPVRQAGARLEELRTELTRITRSALEAYGGITSSPSPSGAGISLLHISDVHGSPIGMDFAVGLARAFDVELVVDTGDITSFGTPLERAVIRAIPAFSVPYVYVRGNHDSPAVGAEIARVPNAHVLEGEIVEVAGLTILGAAHPLYTPDPGFDLTDEEIDETVRAAGEELVSAIAALDEPPDVVAVHDDRMADAAAGLVPLVIAGHFHEPAESVIESTIFLRAGSTGGGGVDAFVDEEPFPLSAQILYFEGVPPRLIAYDEVEVDPETRDLVVDRRLAPEELVEDLQGS